MSDEKATLRERLHSTVSPAVLSYRDSDRYHALADRTIRTFIIECTTIPEHYACQLDFLIEQLGDVPSLRDAGNTPVLQGLLFTLASRQNELLITPVPKEIQKRLMDYLNAKKTYLSSSTSLRPTQEDKDKKEKRPYLRPIESLVIRIDLWPSFSPMAARIASMFSRTTSLS
jgi:hypothetical protein